MVAGLEVKSHDLNRHPVYDASTTGGSFTHDTMVPAPQSTYFNKMLTYKPTFSPINGVINSYPLTMS